VEENAAKWAKRWKKTPPKNAQIPEKVEENAAAPSPSFRPLAPFFHLRCAAKTRLAAGLLSCLV